MSKKSQKIAWLLVASVILFFTLSLPIITKVASTPVVKIAKDPDDEKLRIPTDEDMIVRGDVPKSLVIVKKKKPFSIRVIKRLTKLFRSIADACAPVANVAGALSPAISIVWAIVIWSRGRKREEKDDGVLG